VTGESMTFPKLLRRNSELHAAKAVLVSEDRSLSHGQLDDESRKVAARLVASGVGKAARVGLLAPNSIEWLVTAAAVVRVGGVLVPLSTLLRPPELEDQLRVAAVSHLVVSPDFRGRNYLEDLESVAPGILEAAGSGRRHSRLPSLQHVFRLGDLPTKPVDDALVSALQDAVRPADDLAILYTSGSRGTPKGTIHTHGSGLRAVAAGLESRCIGPGDRVYIPMPFFWTGGFCGGLLSVLVAGATLLTEAIPEPERTLALLERGRATLFRGWPDQAARLAAHPRFAEADLSSLGPGSLPPLLPPGERPAPGARANLFGMTETFGPYCGARLDQDLPLEKYGSCGTPFEGFELRVVDPGTGRECPPGSSGEIQIRGPNVMRAICGRTFDVTFRPDGFYATGDLGALDVDGFLWYHGRLDDMFKVKGATVYPIEVESAIRRIPGVQQAYVARVPERDGSNSVGAFVVTTASLGELVTGVRTDLSAFKVPTRWVVTASADEVPMTATAKVDLPALQAILREGVRA
jgi:acyl-CoA synthetase (AMP-forming)/AMP-acid ligase II